jgi:hypothetical protein
MKQLISSFILLLSFTGFTQVVENRTVDQQLTDLSVQLNSKKMEIRGVASEISSLVLQRQENMKRQAELNASIEKLEGKNEQASMERMAKERLEKAKAIATINQTLTRSQEKINNLIDEIAGIYKNLDIQSKMNAINSRDDKAAGKSKEILSNEKTYLYAQVAEILQAYPELRKDIGVKESKLISGYESKLKTNKIFKEDYDKQKSKFIITQPRTEVHFVAYNDGVRTMLKNYLASLTLL